MICILLLAVFLLLHHVLIISVDIIVDIVITHGSSPLLLLPTSFDPSFIYSLNVFLPPLLVVAGIEVLLLVHCQQLRVYLEVTMLLAQGWGVIRLVRGLGVLEVRTLIHQQVLRSHWLLDQEQLVAIGKIYPRMPTCIVIMNGLAANAPSEHWLLLYLIVIRWTVIDGDEINLRLVVVT